MRCCIDTVYSYIRKGKLKTARPGSTGQYEHGGAPHRIYESDVDELMRARSALDGDPPPAPPSASPSPAPNPSEASS